LDALVGWLPLLGCAAMMFVCLRLMTKGSNNQPHEADAPSTQQEIAELREEVARLRGERAVTGEEEQARG
jgi:hypothetical protein